MKKKIILLHDNTRPHVAKVTQETIMELGKDVLPHSAYSPDLAPFDYQVYRSLNHYLREKTFMKTQKLEIGRTPLKSRISPFPNYSLNFT